MLASQSDTALMTSWLQAKSNVQKDLLDGIFYADDMAKNASIDRSMQEAMCRISQACDNYDLTISKRKY